MSTSTATIARQKFTAKLDALSLDQACAALVTIGTPKTDEEMMVRVGLIKSIEKRYPSIAAWVSSFYDGEDDAPCWDVEYEDAILLARDELHI